MIIFRYFIFDSAHFLPNVPPGHKCRNMHGHTCRFKAFFKGEPDQNLGWIFDFREIRETIDPIINRLDHQVLNEIDGLENPTCEMIAKWL